MKSQVVTVFTENLTLTTLKFSHEVYLCISYGSQMISLYFRTEHSRVFLMEINYFSVIFLMNY